MTSPPTHPHSHPHPTPLHLIAFISRPLSLMSIVPMSIEFSLIGLPNKIVRLDSQFYLSIVWNDRTSFFFSIFFFFFLFFPLLLYLFLPFFLLLIFRFPSLARVFSWRSWFILRWIKKKEKEKETKRREREEKGKGKRKEWWMLGKYMEMKENKENEE